MNDMVAMSPGHVWLFHKVEPNPLNVFMWDVNPSVLVYDTSLNKIYNYETFWDHLPFILDVFVINSKGTLKYALCMLLIT